MRISLIGVFTAALCSQSFAISLRGHGQGNGDMAAQMEASGEGEYYPHHPPPAPYPKYGAAFRPPYQDESKKTEEEKEAQAERIRAQRKRDVELYEEYYNRHRRPPPAPPQIHLPPPPEYTFYQTENTTQTTDI